MQSKIWENKKIGSVLGDMSRFSIEEKQAVEHQKMMGVLVDAGWAVGRWTGAWGKLLKTSHITLYDLERLVRHAQSLSSFCPRGFVRNRLQNKDWHKFDLPK